MNLYQAAAICGITKKNLAAKLGISTSTLYRHQVKECGKGRVAVDGRDKYTADIFTGSTLREEAMKVIDA